MFSMQIKTWMVYFLHNQNQYVTKTCIYYKNFQCECKIRWLISFVNRVHNHFKHDLAKKNNSKWAFELKFR